MEESGQLDRSDQLYSGEKTPVPIEQEGGSFGEEANLFFRIVQPVTYALYRVPHPDSYTR
jgi:hypothetical protein